MLKRKIWNNLNEWKNRKHHPLVISGMRQTGKTFIVKEFGKENYKHVIYIDLRENTNIHKVFDGDFNIDTMILQIGAILINAEFEPYNTLIILDEIQDCPNARSSLKYWDLDGRYDVIATGSFLGVKGFRKPYKRGIPVGYEETMQVFPLTYIEFIENYGIRKEVIDHVDNCIKNGITIPPAIHQSLRSLYYQYLIVGGMPEAVNIFFETKNINEVRRVQKNIIKSISDDFGRYKDESGNEKINETLKLRAEKCLESLPSQLAKEYKKFQYSLVNTKGKSTDKKDGIDYLEDLGMIVKSFKLREMSSPLEGNKIENEFKAFFTDTGLLISTLDDSTPSKILNGDLSAYKGAVAENMIACALNSMDKKLYYYRNSTGSPEIDFIIDEYLVECKSNNGRPTSMKFVLEHEKTYGKHKAVKFSDTNIGNGENFITLPLYAVCFFFGRDNKLIVEDVNTNLFID